MSKSKQQILAIWLPLSTASARIIAQKCTSSSFLISLSVLVLYQLRYASADLSR